MLTVEGDDWLLGGSVAVRVEGWASATVGAPPPCGVMAIMDPGCLGLLPLLLSATLDAVDNQNENTKIRHCVEDSTTYIIPVAGHC